MLYQDQMDPPGAGGGGGAGSQQQAQSHKPRPIGTERGEKSRTRPQMPSSNLLGSDVPWSYPTGPGLKINKITLNLTRDLG